MALKPMLKVFLPHLMRLFQIGAIVISLQLSALKCLIDMGGGEFRKVISAQRYLELVTIWVNERLQDVM